MLLGCIMTRVNFLHRRDCTNGGDSSCLWYPTVPEFEDHLFITCIFMGDIWYKFLSGSKW